MGGEKIRNRGSHARQEREEERKDKERLTHTREG
jgi:hypothetical protein